MNIFDLLSQNMKAGSRTLQPEDAVPYPDGYRGVIEHDAGQCIACNTCAYVCSPSAIKIDDTPGQDPVWFYNEDRCTFCGRCVEYCPTRALSFERVAPQPLNERPQHYLAHSITLQACRQCGQPVRAIPEVTLIRLYGDPLPQDIIAALGLCETCRQKAVGQRFVKTLAGKEK